MTVSAHRPTVAVVDLDAIHHNLRLLRPPQARLMAVVKANAYGHGAVPVARTALEADATWLGVALAEEGVELRDAGVAAPILVLGELAEGSEKEALGARLTPTVCTEEGLRRVAEASAAVGAATGVHVKVDTGMHRLGVDPEAAPAFVERVREAGLQLEGLWTHLAKAEEPDDPFTSRQLDAFRSVAGRLAVAGVRPALLHAANSAGTMTRPDAHYDLVRVGIAMYGLAPGPAVPGTESLRPAMSWSSVVGMVRKVPSGEGLSYGLTYRPERDTLIATVPVGYADGYGRLLSNRAEVVVRERRRPVVGNVTMDYIMVDCGDGPVEPGDEVVLIGRQGDAEVTADEVAGWMGTINYEVVTRVGPRVRREYLGE